MGDKSIDEIIRRAMETGQFDNLPGKGKPLNLEDNPHEDPVWRLAHHVLQSGGFTLPWIETLREIETSLEEARLALRRVWGWREANLSEGKAPQWVEAEWRRAVGVFQEQISSLNKRIQSYNLEVPNDRFQRRPLNEDGELEKITLQTQ